MLRAQFPLKYSSCIALWRLFTPTQLKALPHEVLLKCSCESSNLTTNHISIWLFIYLFSDFHMRYGYAFLLFPKY